LGCNGNDVTREPPALGDFWKFVTKLMHFRHIVAKIQSKNLKQHFDWGGEAGTPGPPSGYALALAWGERTNVVVIMCEGNVETSRSINYTKYEKLNYVQKKYVWIMFIMLYRLFIYFYLFVCYFC